MKPRDAIAIMLGLLFLAAAGCWPHQLRPSDTPDPSTIQVEEPKPLELAAAQSPYQTRPAAKAASPTDSHSQSEPEPPPPPWPTPPAPPVRRTVPPEAEPASQAPGQPVSHPIDDLAYRRLKDPAVVEALRCLLEKRPADAVIPLEKLDKPTQDLLLRFLPLIARLSEGSLEKSDPEELALVTGQLEEVIRTLRPKSALVVDKMCFCRRIDKFGQYDPLPPDYRFKPGEMVQVYVELQNFSSRLVDGLYETRLASSVEIQDVQHRTVWRQDFNDRDRPDKSRSLRGDYFNSYRFCVPENIPPGTYRLVVRISDVHLPERKPAERSLVLRVTTRPLASGRPLAEPVANH